ncbi:SsrA-binding protein SmpB [Phorcysia thermohydrogeniphila]|uniref:SsrA-binding protein n=1 Tax=Phorcysia thermohydrogeniphila TaxID=936138 RepID=A0A4R1GK16_9BACT|nr:SsrA-binding protein SmpB [Phorcysia thermohydrogeniphila]TCK04622.1 SsrA-binding protein [Phorcysia thermohydrogeniphila]
MAGRAPEIKNKKAYHDYEILEKYEAGIALKGTEVKSLREGKANLRDAFVRIEDGEAYLFNAYIAPYSHGNLFNHEPTRKRKLLLHKSEIKRLFGKSQEKGLTIIPLRMYFNERGKVKVEIALAKGRKKYDKREAIKRRELEREAQKAMKFYR